MNHSFIALSEQEMLSAFESNSIIRIAKETSYLFLCAIEILETTFNDKLVSISFECDDHLFFPKNIISSKEKKILINWFEKVKSLKLINNDIEFGKFIIDFQEWYYSMGGSNIVFTYQETYLITSKEAAESLNISKVTFSKYVSSGFQVSDTTKHKKVPPFMVDIWLNHPSYVSKLKAIYEYKHSLSFTEKEHLNEILFEIFRLEKKYNTTDLDNFFKNAPDTFEITSDSLEWSILKNEKNAYSKKKQK